MKLTINKTDKNILINDLPLYVYYGNYCYISPEDIKITESNCGYILTIKNKEPVTLVFPCHNRRVLVGDNYDFVDTRSVLNFYCEGPTNILPNHFEKVYAPVFHLIDSDCWSVSTYGESFISFFTSNYEQYGSITGVPPFDEIQFFIDVSANYQVNLQRHNIKQREITFTDCLDENEIKSAIYYKAKLINKFPNIELFIDKAAEIQSYFDAENLYSVIIGSLAENLNGIESFVNDFDFMFKNYPSVKHAAEILLEYGWLQKSENNRSITLEKESQKIDLSIDNYRILQFPVYVRQSHGFRFLDNNGLFWLALLNQQEFDRTPYKNAYPRNNRVLFELTLNASRKGLMCNDKIAESLINLPKQTDECKKILDDIYNLPLLYRDNRVNEPFKVNCFGSNNYRVFTIINTGTVADMRLVTDMKPSKLQWRDINCNKKEVRIEYAESFSIIFIDKIDVPGILICEDI